MIQDKKVDSKNLSLFGSASSPEEKVKMMQKLHRQFSHAPYNRIKGLLNDAGIDSKENLDVLKKVCESCKICQEYKKTPQRPVVGLSMAHRLNETVAMDLKEWKEGSSKTWFLHMVDHATRYSASSVIKSKRKDVIVAQIFNIWVKIFGYPNKILVDNGGEFDNGEFQDFCENLNIKIKTTAAESPWSNGLVERHNGIIGESVTKIMNEVKCDLSVALSWAVSAKNSLQNVHGFSPNQLVFGRNPNFPSVMHDKLPALEGKTTSEVVSDNLNAMHSARKAFIASEASEKIRRALRHNVGKSVDVKYITGDSVYYKRKDDAKWKGPGTVIGQDGQQVLVKHGSVYVRVHPCRLVLEKGKETQCLQQRNRSDETIGDKGTILSEQTNQNDDSSENEDEQQQDETSGDKGATLLEQANQKEDSKEIEDGQQQAAEETSEMVISHAPDIQKCGVQEPENPSQKEFSIPKLKQKVRYLPMNKSNWKAVEVVSRAGKAKGKYKHWLNVRNEDNTMESIDWENGVREWHPYESSAGQINHNGGNLDESAQHSETVYFSVDKMNLDPVLISEAKEKELNNWKKNNVYEVQPYIGQNCISTRWVFTEKFIDGRKVVKARLVARGFEEETSFQVDSPTCSKEALRLASTLMVTNNWNCNSIDVRAAFLQGKQLERDVFIEPPPEIEDEKVVWKLNVCVYGLSDAPRAWYLRVKEVLISLGAQCCKHDAGLFYWHKDGCLRGLIVIHVDDFFWGGDNYFMKQVIQSLKETFEIGTEETGSFKYLGLHITQKKKGVEIEQGRYCQSLKPLEVSKERKAQRNLPLGSVETKKLRALIGQMNWAATQTRPDVLFECCVLASNIKNATVSDMLEANKVLKKLQNDVKLNLPPLDDINSLKFVVHSDASYANLSDGGSQGGYVIFLSDSVSNKLSPVAWQSRRIKRVVKSTLAAEMLALVEAAEAGYWLQSILNEIMCTKGCNIECYIDSQSLYNAANSTTSLTDRRLRVDVAIIREMLQKSEIQKLVWVPSGSQLADCLTKKGASSSLIVQVLTSNQL